MGVSEVLAALKEWSGVLAPTLAAAGAGVAWVAGNHMARRKQRGDERSQDLAAGAALTSRSIALVDQLQEEVTRARAWLDQSQAELQVLRAARLDLEDRVGQLYANFLAARTMLHELQRRLDVPETVFPETPRLRPGVTGPPAA